MPYPRRTTAATARAVATAGTLWLAAAMPPAFADAADEVREWRLPGGSLERSLNRLAREAGITLSFDPQAVRGEQAPALEGEYTLGEALDRLLEGTGLRHRITGGDRVVVQARSAEGELEAIQIEAVPQIDTYARDDRYRVDSSSFALGGTNEILQETPFSVSPVETDFLNDVDPIQLDGIAEYTAGVQRGNQVNNTSQAFQSRGFQLGRDSILINGTQQSDGFAITPTELVSAVEFYRGPSSVLNGQTPPGGAANVVTKKPLPEAFTRLTGTLDQHGQRKLALDYNSGRFGEGTLPASLRVNIVAEDSDTFRDDIEREVGVLAPVLTLDLSRRTRLTLEANFIDWEAPDDRGLPLFGADADEAAAQRFDQSDFVLGTTEEVNDREQDRFMVDLSHEISDRLTTNFQLSYGETERSQFAIFPLQINPANGLLVRTHFGTRDEFESLDARLDTEFRFDTGPVSHSGIAALQFREFERRDEFTGFGNDQVDPDDPPSDNPFLGFGPGRGLERDQGSTELFLQDRVRVNEGPLAGFFTVLGLRRIAFEDDLDSGRDEDETTWRLGVGYTPPAARWLTVYANYAESFDPQQGVTASGDALPPSEGEQTEVGVKASLLDDNLLLTAAVFDLEQSDFAVDDPDAADPSADIAVGEQENQGFELEAVGQLTEHLRMRAQYTHNDGEVTEATSSSGLAGNELQLTPDNSASVWLTHDAVPLPGNRPGLSVGGGLVYVGDRFATTANQIELSSYGRLDLKAGYEFGNSTSLDLNVRNVTDEDYFVGGNTFGLGSVLPGQTRTVAIELSHQF